MIMTGLLSYILWNPSLEAFSIGPFAVRWYSLCWLIGLLLAYLVVRWLYNDQKVPQEKIWNRQNCLREPCGVL